MFLRCLLVCLSASAFAQAGPPLVGVRYAAPQYAHHPAPLHLHHHLAPAYAHPAHVYAHPGYAVPSVKYAGAPLLHAAPAAPVLTHAAPVLAHHAPVLAHHAPVLAHHAPVLAHHAPVVAQAAPAVVAHAAPVAAVKLSPVVQHAPSPYDFGYNLQTDDGGSAFRSETSDEYNNKKGSYGYTAPDGVYRQVDYIADGAGFRATVRTNEQGTANQNPASVAVLAEEPPIKVVKTVTPIVRAAVAAPVYATPIVKPVLQAAPVYAAPTYAAPAAVVKTPVYASAASPALVRAPLYAHAAAVPVYGRHVAAVAPYQRAYY